MEINAITTIDSYVGWLLRLHNVHFLLIIKGEHLCRKQHTRDNYYYFFFFLFDIFFEYEIIHKTSFARLLIEWRKSEDFLHLYLGTHYVIEPSHYGTYFELRKEIIFRLCSCIIIFLIFGIIFIKFILYNIQFSVVYIIRSDQ